MISTAGGTGVQHLGVNQFISHPGHPAVSHPGQITVAPSAGNIIVLVLAMGMRSLQCGPAIVASIWAASMTVRGIGPWLEKLLNSSDTPLWGTYPIVPFIPTTPLQAAGILIEAPASVPMDRGAMLAAQPRLEPPLIRDRSHGWTARPNNGASFIRLWPNSSVETLPTGTAPAAFMRATATASCSRKLCSNISEA